MGIIKKTTYSNIINNKEDTQALKWNLLEKLKNNKDFQKVKVYRHLLVFNWKEQPFQIHFGKGKYADFCSLWIVDWITKNQYKKSMYNDCACIPLSDKFTLNQAYNKLLDSLKSYQNSL